MLMSRSLKTDIPFKVTIYFWRTIEAFFTKTTIVHFLLFWESRKTLYGHIAISLFFYHLYFISYLASVFLKK